MTMYRLTWHIWRTRRREGVRLSWARAARVRSHWAVPGACLRGGGMPARAYVAGDVEITDLCRNRVAYPPSAERSYWLATGVEDGYDYWLRDDEITVQAARPVQYCMHISSRTSRELQGDPCENEALDDSDYCAEHDGLMDTEWAYAEYIDRIHGDYL